MDQGVGLAEFQKCHKKLFLCKKVKMDGCPDEIRPSTIFRTYGINFARHGHVPVKHENQKGLTG